MRSAFVSVPLPIAHAPSRNPVLLHKPSMSVNGGARVMSLQWTAARLLDDATSFRLKGLLVTNRRYAVPLDYSGALGGEVEVFVREVVNTGPHDLRSSLPCLVYFQGGPGFESPRLSESGEFVRKLARDHRMLLLDQRGTGLSTPVVTETLEGMTAAERLAYLRCFRADSIVRDAELIRRALLDQGGKWSILGQSFGGFCCLTYLSYFPWGIEKALIAGGLAPVTAGCSAETVYRNLVPRVLRQMDKFYEIFPGDEDILRDLVLHIDRQENGVVPLPSGSVLSVRGLQAIGISCLGVPGGFARLHYMLERAWVTKRLSGERVLSYYFLKSVDDIISFDTNPLYMVLHEACYCNGPGANSGWAADRVIRTEFPQFDALKSAQAGGRIYLTGEMMFPWMLDEIVTLRPWKETAIALSKITDWDPLYNTEALKGNPVPAAAVAYHNDTMVDFTCSMATADRVNNLHVWVTSEYSHAGLREGSDRVIDMMNNMLQGKVTLER